MDVNPPTQHVGVLFRGADGTLWVIRDNQDPLKVTDAKTKNDLTKYLPQQEDQPLITLQLPQEVYDELGKAYADFGPMAWCWVFCSAARLTKP